MVDCPTCGADNPSGAKFCNECGASLTQVCASCRTSNASGAKFCSECGTTLRIDVTAQPPPVAEAERRLVSVLFADLVGFTTASETRDAEETRELLSSYFELARTLIGRHGGTIEKFIGDAVMAVWGTPVTTEDDAERAVRVALELVEAIPELGPNIQARVGVLTGEAAVTLGAEGQGMVAGDLVNTAARIQTAAEPGTVLVGEVTRRTTEQAIAYADAGAHELKGKLEPVPLFRALRVVSGRAGSMRSAGLEAPFVGRDRELKLIKDMFHGAAENGSAHLVSVTGIAGIGKSRLAWEFYKYFDGIVENVYWHRGRCLPYGEGVAYWALADMVRMRCLIGEDEAPDSARGKLASALAEHILDPEEREFVEPRVAHLLGFDEGAVGDRQDLFAAWRLFFERLADVYPTVLAFEDMQWADASLLDFVEYLLEWSRDSPLYVITLARPELQEKRPSWGAGQRNFTSLYLEPLSGQAMGDLLEGLVPGLPDELRARILERAQGVPLYAVETVRMLLDRGLLVREGPVYRATGEIETLAVPETLHALIAARLDGVSPEERRLLQDGAVLGKTFTVAALAALADSAPADLQALLAGLVRKEVLGVQSDPRSPERGQYGFLQDLVRHVAYETLSKRERKSRHLAAASHLRRAFPDEDEVAEVLAAHYLAAVEAAPGADDAAASRTQAREMLTRAGERASSLGALDEGRRYYDQAAALAEETLAQAVLLERAGGLAQRANQPAEARERLERAHSLNLEGGDAKAAARVNAALAEVDFVGGAYDAALVRLEQVTAELERAGALVELAGALALFGRVNAIRGHVGPAAAATDRALALAEHLLLPDVFVEALTTRAVVLLNGGRLAEARILLEAAAERARAEQLYGSALRADNNLATVLQAADRYTEVTEAVDRGIALARRRGERRLESVLRTGNIVVLFMLGRWDEACASGRDEAPAAVSEIAQLGLLDLAKIACERGDLDEARRMISDGPRFETSENPQSRAGFAAVSARVLRAEGDHAGALAAARRGLALREELSMVDIAVKESFVEAVESSLALGDLELADELLLLSASLDPGDLTPFLQASADRLRARLQAARGSEDGVEDGFRSSGALLREFGIVFHAAVAELEHAEWLVAQGRADEAGALVSAALETFARLEARPWLQRARRVSDSAAGAASSAITSNQT